jgi:hypothetical protein
MNFMLCFRLLTSGSSHPLRDGINTTLVEFVIAQDKPKKSPLVLSEFMGISKEMHEALQVNPWNIAVRDGTSPNPHIALSFGDLLYLSNANSSHPKKMSLFSS